jgi:hypothetical protein
MCFIRGRRQNEAEVVPALSCPDILLFAVGYEIQWQVHGLQKKTRMWVGNASGRVDDHIQILMRPTDDPRSPNTGSENSHDLDNKRTVTHLLVDDLAVYFSSGDVIIATQSDVEVALVVAEVEVDLATVVQDVDFACWALYMST